MDPTSSADRTQAAVELFSPQIRPDDVVLGEVLGLGELLIVAPSEPAKRRILVADVLDPRVEWFGAEGLAPFLDSYFEASGERFWDPSTRHE